MQLNELQQKVFNDRYALKNKEGKQIETSVEQMWNRVAKAVASVEEKNNEEWENKFNYILHDFQFIPGGRILSGAGTQDVTMFNCFVIPSPEDSRQGILKAISDMVEIMARGGGVGINLSTLRYKDAYVKGVNGKSSGVIAWANLFSEATGSVIQGGSRRGALMLMLNVDHPDIIDFINAKEEKGKLENANLSVGISEEFIKAVKNNQKWDLKFDGKVIRTVNAIDIWNLICEKAWQSGEPGVVFLDRYNKESNTWYYEDTICCNPCGEQGLPAWGVCNLGNINLEQFVVNGEIAWESLAEVIQIAVRFLDNVIDLTPYFFEENERTQKNSRRIGLGTLGLANLLIKMKIKYGSNESLELIEELYKFIRDEAYSASIEISKEKGQFPKYNREKLLKGQFIRRLPEGIQSQIAYYGIRNATLLTQAPTGSTGMLANTSSGIEPNFEFEYKRKDRLGEHIVKHPLFEGYTKENKPEYFVTAMELTPEEHILVQSTIQKYVDSSISKTVNAPANHSLDEVKNLYMLAYDSGCKGITYYREGSRDGVLQTIKDEPKQIKSQKLEWGTTLEASDDLIGKKRKIMTGCGSLHVQAWFDPCDGRLMEVYFSKGSDGGCNSWMISNSRTISTGLRTGVSFDSVIDQLKSTPACPSYSVRTVTKKDTSKGNCCPAATANALIDMQNEVYDELGIEDDEQKTKSTSEKVGNKCPECGEILKFAEGCQSCVCGYSKCN